MFERARLWPLAELTPQTSNPGATAFNGLVQDFVIPGSNAAQFEYASVRLLMSFIADNGKCLEQS